MDASQKKRPLAKAHRLWCNVDPTTILNWLSTYLCLFAHQGRGQDAGHGAHVRVVSLHGCFNFCVILQLGGLASPWCGRCHWLAACRRSWLTTASAGFAKHQRRRHDSEREARGLRPPRLLLPNPRPQARSRSPRREDAGGEVADAVAGEAAGRPPRGWAPDGPWRPGGATATPLATLQAAGKLGDALGDVRAYACT